MLPQLDLRFIRFPVRFYFDNFGLSGPHVGIQENDIFHSDGGVQLWVWRFLVRLLLVELRVEVCVVVLLYIGKTLYLEHLRSVDGPAVQDNPENGAHAVPGLDSEIYCVEKHVLHLSCVLFQRNRHILGQPLILHTQLLAINKLYFFGVFNVRFIRPQLLNVIALRRHQQRLCLLLYLSDASVIFLFCLFLDHRCFWLSKYVILKQHFIVLNAKLAFQLNIILKRVYGPNFYLLLFLFR